MKNLFGSPGRVSGLVIRVLQCLFAAASIGIMISSSGFSTSTAFCYLIASMGIQFLWSFGLACLDMHALRIKKDLQNHLLVSLFAVGDWVTSILSLSAACASAGVVVLFAKDTELCKTEATFNCEGFEIAVTMAFISWLFLAISSHVMFWLMASSWKLHSAHKQFLLWCIKSLLPEQNGFCRHKCVDAHWFFIFVIQIIMYIQFPPFKCS